MRRIAEDGDEADHNWSSRRAVCGISALRIARGSEFLRTRLDKILISFWFVPGLMALAGAFLSVIAIELDEALAGTGPFSGFIFVSDPQSARELLTTLLSSMITMASLVFSITMVVLSLAASQFGPRLIRSFMSSPQTQLVLGTFVMTIVYCLLALAANGSHEEGGPLPSASVTGALALALISVALLVLYLHGLARSIMSETVIERVGRELNEVLKTLPPLGAAAEPGAEEMMPADFEDRAAFLGPRKAGYVQAIEIESIVAAARSADALVGLYFRAGDFVLEDGRGIAVYPAERLDDELAGRVTACLMIGAHRTPQQDPDFSIRHLVEIAVRALSPGINDPYTAVSAINQLSASLSHLLGRALPPGVYRDDADAIRLICPRPTYGSLMAAAFDQIRQNGADKPVVVIHLLEAIGRIAPHASLPEQREALHRQLQIIVDAARRRTPDPSDLTDIERHAEAAQTLLHRSERAAQDERTRGRSAEGGVS